MRGFGVYLLWQAPGWAVVAAVLWVLVRLLDLPVTVAGLVLGLFVLKDLVLFPVMRVAYLPSRLSPWPIGERGEAIETLEPAGYVRVHGELWKAEARAPERRIAAGRPVIVRAARGFTLLVDEDRGPR